MSIATYKGERKLPLELTAASQLLRNRVVKVTAGVPAYPGYGDEAVGYTSHIGDPNDYEVQVNPFKFAEGTFRLRLAGTVTANAVLCATGTTGCVRAADYTVRNRSQASAASSTNGYIFLVPVGGWGGTHAHDIATCTGTTNYTYATPATGAVCYVTQEDIYLVFNGTIWVRTKALCYASEAGISGDEIVCYPLLSQYNSREGIAATDKQAITIVCAGQSATETDSDASVVVADGRILSTDFAVATAAAGATPANCQINLAVCTTATLTITLAGNGGAGTLINYIVFRSNDA